jgi:hypothetical protein
MPSITSTLIRVTPLKSNAPATGCGGTATVHHATTSPPPQSGARVGSAALAAVIDFVRRVQVHSLGRRHHWSSPGSGPLHLRVADLQAQGQR